MLSNLASFWHKHIVRVQSNDLVFTSPIFELLRLTPILTVRQVGVSVCNMNTRLRLKPHRRYRQVARAKAAAETGRRIIDAFAVCAGDRWFDEITLQEVAARAGVTVQSVIRRFGSKEGLIKAMVEEFGPDISADFSSTPGDIDAAISRLFAGYERVGDGVMRNLAQEKRVPALQPLLDFGRKEHRRITAEQFAPYLEQLQGTEQRDALDALVIAADIYTWKLLRRDMGRSVADSKRAVKRLIEAVLAAYGTRSRRDGEV